MLLLFVLHQMALGLFRMIATLARDMIIANTFASASLLAIFLLGGFIIPKGKAFKIKCTYCTVKSYPYFNIASQI